MARKFVAADNVSPRPAKSTPGSYPQKNERPVIYKDDYAGVQSGATLRNRYEDGEWLPQASRAEEGKPDRDETEAPRKRKR